MPDDATVASGHGCRPAFAHEDRLRELLVVNGGGLRLSPRQLRDAAIPDVGEP